VNNRDGTCAATVILVRMHERRFAMPLRDHFRSPVNDRHTWDELHGSWPTFIVMALKPKLPPGYVAIPRIHIGAPEIDVASFESNELQTAAGETSGVATQVWAAPKPTLDAIAEPPDQDEYEVLVYDTKRNRRLVAAVEIVSPSNKDRPDSRNDFVRKCATLLKEHVSVGIIDLVTTRRSNLYAELLEDLGQTDPELGSNLPATYAAVCRWTQNKKPSRFQTWTHQLKIGEALPTLPLWLSDDLALPLELEGPYEQACALVDIE
jgi:hypothetical protein